MTEFRVNDVDLQEFLHSFTDGNGKLPSDFEQLKREGHYLIHGDAERVFCLKEREIYLKDTMENLLARSICFFSNMPISYAVHVKASGKTDITVLDNKRLAMEIKEKQWSKMLDIFVNEKPVYCSKELLVAMKVEAKYEASNAKKEKDKIVLASIVRKITCFLEAVENHNLSHLLKENALKRELPDFLSADEKEKLTKMYHFPTKEQTMVADRSTRYQEAVAR